MKNFKVSIKNLSNIETHAGEFENQELAQAWISEQQFKERPWSYVKDGEYSSQQDGAVDTEVVSRVDGLGNEHLVYIVPEQYTIDIIDQSAKLAVKESNDNNLKFLSDSDWKVLRHRDQLELNIPTSLDHGEYEKLLEDRQNARDSIVR